MSINNETLNLLFKIKLFEKYKPKIAELKKAIEEDDTIKVEQIFNEIKGR